MPASAVLWLVAFLALFSVSGQRQEADKSQTLLLSHATKVADTNGWQGQYVTFYRWLTNKTLLFARFSRDSGFSYYTLDADSHRIMRLDALSKQINNTSIYNGAVNEGPGGLPNGLNGLEVSPNGKLILFSTVTGKACVSTLNGSPPLEWPSHLISMLSWLPDSDRWIEIPQGAFASELPKGVSVSELPKQTIYLRSVSDPNYRMEKRLDFSIISDFSGLKEIGARTLADGGTLLYLVCWGKHNQAIVCERRLEGDPKVTELFSFPFDGTNAGMDNLSPQCDQIAWLAVSRPDSTSLCLWRSKIDGSDKHQIGCIPIKSYDETYQFQNLRWLPDGSKLSFIYKNELWIVPAK